MGAVEISEVIRNWAIVVGGAVGLGLAIWRGFSHDRQARAQGRQADVSQRAHITDVFTTAVGLLRDDKLEIRLGAVYTLCRIANDFSAEFENPVIELFTAYVRERTENDDVEVLPSVDILEIIKFIQDKRPVASTP